MTNADDEFKKLIEDIQKDASDATKMILEEILNAEINRQEKCLWMMYYFIGMAAGCAKNGDEECVNKALGMAGRFAKCVGLRMPDDKRIRDTLAKAKDMQMGKNPSDGPGR